MNGIVDILRTPTTDSVQNISFLLSLMNFFN